jgi:hypothetical protein
VNPSDLANQAADVIASNMEAISELQASEKQASLKIGTLQGRIAELEAEIKQASQAPQGFLPVEEDVEPVVEHMHRLGFITAAEKQAARAALCAAPEKLIDVCARIASHVSSPMTASDGSAIKLNSKFAGSSTPGSTRPWY